MQSNRNGCADRMLKTDKPLPNQLSPYLRLRYGYRALFGANLYGKGNYLKGFPKEESLECLHRHLALYESGDTSEDHLSAIIFNVQAIMLAEEKEGIKTDHYHKK